jgi:hypothetical protein
MGIARQLTNPEVIRITPEGTAFTRAQDSEHDTESRFYNKKSDSRYGSTDLPVGVLYLGFSDTVAVAEVFQPPRDDTPVKHAKLEQCSLHQLVAVRDLKLIDLPMSANPSDLRLRDVVRASAPRSQMQQSLYRRPRTSISPEWRRPLPINRFRTIHR